MASIGDRIKLLRTERKLTCQELGDIVGRSKSNISGYESGKFEPSAHTIIALAGYFHVSTDWLLLGECGLKSEQQNGTLPVGEQAQLLHMFSALDAIGQEDIFDYLSLKYEKQLGKKGSLYSTYIEDTEQQKSAPADEHDAHCGTA